ncbi:MAG TPA: tripartite tricarboxylate transporter substrate-binding protein [Candidatus Binatia bacterium]|nr:tripartite tricarboxylate transporter substrate-binding protein [Candidatus Binatia bacterium]
MTYRPVFGIIALFVLRQISSAAAAEPRSFYEGRTMTMIISTSPGGATDVAGRLLSRHLGKYIPGHPNIIAQNMPGAGGIVSANYLFNIAKPDGLTILAVNRANYLEQMVGRPEVKLDFRKLNWIGSFNRAPMMITCRKDSPYTTVENMRAAKTPARFGEGGTGSISYVFSALVSEILDFKVKHVTGYGSAREIDLGVERGEADCRATSDITLVRPPWPTWVQQGFMTFVVQQGPAKSRVLPQTTPTVYELAPPSTKPMLNLMDVMVAYTDFDRPFAAPPGVPKDRLQILRDAFEKTLADANFIAEAKKLVDWDSTSYLSGANLQKKIETTVTQPPDVIKRIKDILKEAG